MGEAFDPNDDYSNYVASTKSERTLLDVRGAGSIYRFWHTDDAMDSTAPGGTNPAGSDITYHLYFDGASVPSWILPARRLWSGELPEFPAPLTLDAETSSGGAVSYRPITFARGLRVTTPVTARTPVHDYFNIGYSLYSNAAEIATFDGCEDTSFAAEVLARAGENPVPAHREDVRETVTFDLIPGTTHEVGRWQGPGLITELRFDIPELRREHYPVFGDDGRVHRGASSFELTVPADNRGVRLVRRLEDVGAQSAAVSIDGSPVGVWSTPGGGDRHSPTRVVNAWLDSSFEIPVGHTAGKARIRVRIEAGAGSSWSEFRYWAVARTDGGNEVVSDELDIGDSKSEAAHAYSTSAPDWMGHRMYRPLDPVVIAGINDARALERLRLKVFWDDAPAAAVDAPFSQFFGTGAGFVATVKALMLGHDAGRFYSYFPMPYAKSARVVLEYPADTPILRSVVASIRTRPYALDFDELGHFHAEARGVERTTFGKDYEVVSVAGQGHYVGANLILPGMGWTLEGDERIFVDGLRTPSISGTGTEDYVNGGWYFSRGPFTAPFSGAPERAGWAHPVSIYRHHILDAVPFRTSIRVALEHDGINFNEVPYASVAYYYRNQNPGMTPTDVFLPADAADAAAHDFRVGEPEPELASVTSRFFTGEQSDPETRSGVVSRTRMSFTIAIDPCNEGIVLRRVSDQQSRDQAADVFVGEQLVGTWYAAGGSTNFRWREDEFWLPGALTQGRTALPIRLEARSADWNAYEYRAFALDGCD